MSNGKPCEAHHIPEDICGPCNAAAEERQRIIGVIEMFRDDWKQNGLPWKHWQILIQSIESPE
jgi:hypothetical protein